MAPVLIHSKSGRSIDVDDVSAEYYQVHGWVVDESKAQEAAEAEAKKGSDDAGTDSSEGATTPRKTTSRSATAKN
ncbi:hypothetical protein [Pseudarthrobacter sp. PS3-L1]|uniref:hypothetical protein n=1 Tax=Pseudarthrobacter sp. PS3-L1 TaxID=3046207 RepID=UPI0024B9CA3C|nr:hypothetical protein [Pseudarthrobacter sp. PS3-L1]MDJ0321663.1 hypothetical protein [Pseudarthrobacter sp. PS3-L1]